MKFYSLDICPNNKCGLCNQLYSIVAGVKYCIFNNINIMFINKFLKSINTNNYCNINEIIDIDLLNTFLQKYQVYIVDYNNFNFYIENALLTSFDNTLSIDITNYINTSFYKNNNFIIPKNVNLFNNLNLAQYLKNDSDNENINKINLYEEEVKYIIIKYKLNNGYFTEKYILINNKLIENINYNFSNINFEGNFRYEQDELFFNILRNINFNTNIINKSKEIYNELILKNINTNIINVIHLRIEEDALEHFYKSLDLEKEIYKNMLIQKYINLIKKHLNKNDKILVLTYSINNEVIDFLKENNYNYIINENKETNREISAIIDLLLGEYCNNYYICVWESSFSYTLFSKINKKRGIKALQIELNNLNKNEEYVRLKY